jgi:RNA polymerase sigma-70 factor (ECF subfamily)
MALPRKSTEYRPHNMNCAALVERIASGDKSAFAALYDTTCGLIYGLLLRILGSSEKAEQILVAVYQEVWEQASSYNGVRKNQMTWLITIAHRRAVAQLKADKSNQPGPASFELASPTQTAKSKTDTITSDEQQFMQSAFAKLSPTQQQIIELTYFSGLHQNEISALLGLSLQSVQLGTRTAMQKLHEVIASNQLHLA